MLMERARIGHPHSLSTESLMLVKNKLKKSLKNALILSFSLGYLESSPPPGALAGMDLKARFF